MITEAVAAVYGDALYELAREGGAEALFREELGFLADYAAGEPDFAALLATPGIGRQAKRELLRRVLDGRLDRRVVDLLCIMVDRNRQQLLPQVRERFVVRHDRDLGRVQVRVRSALPLSPGLERRLTDALVRRTGGSIELQKALEPELLGGLVLEYGDVHVDASVARGLRRIRRRLHEHLFETKEVCDEDSSG